MHILLNPDPARADEPRVDANAPIQPTPPQVPVRKPGGTVTRIERDQKGEERKQKRDPREFRDELELHQQQMPDEHPPAEPRREQPPVASDEPGHLDLSA